MPQTCNVKPSLELVFFSPLKCFHPKILKFISCAIRDGFLKNDDESIWEHFVSLKLSRWNFITPFQVFYLPDFMEIWFGLPDSVLLGFLCGKTFIIQMVYFYIWSNKESLNTKSVTRSEIFKLVLFLRKDLLLCF